MQGKGAAEGFKGTSRIAAHGQAQLGFRQVLLGGQMQSGIDRVGRRTLRFFIAAEELHAERMRRTGIEAQGGVAAVFAVLDLDAAPAIATAHEVIGETTAGTGTRMLGITNQLGPATRKIGGLKRGSCGTSHRHDAAESCN